MRRALILLIVSGCVISPHNMSANRILVTGGDPWTKYETLGPVAWPNKENAPLRGCPNPDTIKTEAYAIWGERVDAIVGFRRWGEGHKWRCEGIAVQFKR